MEFPLRQTLGKPAAATDRAGGSAHWLLPYADPQAWAEEVCSWPCDQTAVRCYPIAAGTGGGDVAALFVVLAGPVRRAAVGRALPCRLIHGRLAVPEGSDLRYPIIRDDLADLLADPLGLLHPVYGLVSLAPEDALGLEELFEDPDPTAETWSWAHPGEPPLPGLRGIGVIIPEDACDQLLQEAKGEIGRTDPKGLPRRPGEGPLAGVEDLVKHPGDAFFKGILNLTSRVPDTAAQPTWINRLEDWAAGKLSSLKGAQNREIERLLHLMRSDPDEGLKFALPLGDHGPSSRGSAPPGWQLGRRDVRFTLGALFDGGRPIEPWMLPPEDYERLLESYRAAANRELELGRYRRAAYIFAELLGDYRAAASALRQGWDFREAATLFEKKLEDLRSAAECFRQAALYDEAVRLYEELGDHLALGELFGTLGREAESRAAFEAAVKARLADDRPAAAAEIVLERFGDERRALGIYRSAWPQSREAATCLRAEFALYAGAGLHREALLRVTALRDGVAETREKRPELARRLVELGRDYPSAEVNHCAADAARVVASAVWMGAGKKGREARQLVEVLPGVAPDDLLLRRDVRRFGDGLGHRPQPRPPGLQAGELVSVVNVRRMRSDLLIFDAAPSGDGRIALLRHTRDGVNLAVVTKPESPEARVRKVDWKVGANDVRCVPHLAVNPRPPGLLIVGVAGLKPRTVPGVEVPVRGWPAGNDRDRPLAVAADDSGALCELALAGGSLVLRWYWGTKVRATELISSLPEGVEIELALAMQRVPLVATRQRAFFALGTSLARCCRGKVDWVNLPSPVLDLAATDPLVRLRLAVGMEKAAALIWEDRLWHQPEFIGNDLGGTHVAFTRAGHLVAAGQNRVEAYATGRGEVVYQGSAEFSGEAVAVVPGSRPDQFFVAGEDALTAFELRPRGG